MKNKKTYKSPLFDLMNMFYCSYGSTLVKTSRRSWRRFLGITIQFAWFWFGHPIAHYIQVQSSNVPKCYQNR